MILQLRVPKMLLMAVRDERSIVTQTPHRRAPGGGLVPRTDKQVLQNSRFRRKFKQLDQQATRPVHFGFIRELCRIVLTASDLCDLKCDTGQLHSESSLEKRRVRCWSLVYNVNACSTFPESRNEDTGFRLPSSDRDGSLRQPKNELRLSDQCVGIE